MYEAEQSEAPLDRARGLVAGLLSIALALACSSDDTDGDRPSRVDCASARAHEAALAVGLARTTSDDARTRAELASHQATLAEVGGDDAIERCVATDSKKRLRCVVAAASLGEVAACAER